MATRTKGEGSRHGARAGRRRLRARVREARAPPRRGAATRRREDGAQDHRARARGRRRRGARAHAEVRRREPRRARGDARRVGRGVRDDRPGRTAPRSARPRCACASSTASASRRAGRCARRAAAYFGTRVRAARSASASTCPAARPSYPSTVIMNAVPASRGRGARDHDGDAAASRDGKLRPEVLMAARVAGVHRVFKMGGAQAIAALAYGTAAVPRVDKIVGPGNVYVRDGQAARVRRGRHRQRGRADRGAGRSPTAARRPPGWRPT